MFGSQLEASRMFLVWFRFKSLIWNYYPIITIVKIINIEVKVEKGSRSGSPKYLLAILMYENSIEMIKLASSSIMTVLS